MAVTIAACTILLSLLCLTSAQKPRCGNFCTFFFCKADGFDTVFDRVGPKLLLRDPVVASQPFVCRKIVSDPTKPINQTVKIAASTAEALVYPASERNLSPLPIVPVTEFSPDGLSPKLSANYFSLQEITRFPAMPGKYSLQRMMSIGNQEEFVDDLCVVLPIPDYDLLNDDDGSVEKEVRGSMAMEDCVSFRTVVPSVLIEFTWNTADDLDLEVIEPDMNVIDSENSRSETGGRLISNDNEGAQFCGIDSNGREQVRWLKAKASPLNGKYEIVLKHFKNCGKGETAWNLKVVVGGKQVLFKEGVSDLDADKEIARLDFELSL